MSTNKEFIAKHLAFLAENVAEYPALEDSITVWLDLWTRTPQGNIPHANRTLFPQELRKRMEAHRRKQSAFGPAFLDGYLREQRAVWHYLESASPTIDYLLDIGRQIQITQEECAYWAKLGNVDASAAGVLWRIGPSIIDAQAGLLRHTEILNFKKWDGKEQIPVVKSAGRQESPTTKLCRTLLAAGCTDFKSACEYIDAHDLRYPPIERDSFRTAFNREKDKQTS